MTKPFPFWMVAEVFYVSYEELFRINIWIIATVYAYPVTDCHPEQWKVVTYTYIRFKGGRNKEGKLSHTHFPFSPPSRLLRPSFLLRPLWSISADSGLNTGVHISGNACCWSKLYHPGHQFKDFWLPSLSLNFSLLSATHAHLQPEVSTFRSDPMSSLSVLWLCRLLIVYHDLLLDIIILTCHSLCVQDGQ